MGRVGMRFEKNRKKNRFENFLQYVKESFATIYDGIPKIEDCLYTTNRNNANSPRENKIHKSDASLSSFVELIVLNIPGIWASKTDLWSTTIIRPTSTFQPQSVCDSLIEIMAINSVKSYIMKFLFGFKQGIRRVSQPNRITIRFKSCPRLFLMIDGEFLEINSLHFVDIFPNNTPVRIMCSRNSKIALHQKA